MDRFLIFLGGLPARLYALPLRFRLPLAAAAGLLCLCGMPPWNLWPLLVPGMGLFYLLLVDVRAGAFRIGYAFGLGYTLPGLAWIGNALLVEGNPYLWAYPLALIGLPVLLSFFPAVFARMLTRLCDLRIFAGFAGFVVLLTLTEWLRGHLFTGFPWNLFGYAWSSTLPVAQFAAVAGIYGLTLLTILWAAAPGFLIAWSATPRHKTAIGTAVFLSFLVCFLAGSARLSANPPALRPDVALNIVQPNIPQADKWNPEKQIDNLKKLLALTKPPASDEPARATLVIWPETAVTARLLQHEQVKGRVAEQLASFSGAVYLASGVLRIEAGEKPRYYNSLVTYDEALHEIAAYDKAHLVPFGEYIPFQHWIPLAPVAHFSGFEAGVGPQTQEIPAAGLRLAPLICYEIIFPRSARHQAADLIVNVTNDAWYGDSAGPRQHLVMAQFRAIEQGIPAARSANTGISGLFDAYGRQVAAAPLDTAQALYVPLPSVTSTPTLYSRAGDLLLLPVVCLAVLAIMRGRKTLKKTK